jgi:acetyl-CoA/propionyl-CoA carboxylase biotin carboxyl carrier protein
VWIGPPPEAIELMGSKIAARSRMAEAGVPIIPGTTKPIESVDEVIRLGEDYGWPVAIKASAGGGGKGLKVVAGPEHAERSLAAARREGEAYFSDPAVYVEKFIDDPRHVEVQVLADDHGNVVHLGERDCTIQRRHQKIVEETPSPAVTAELRERIGRIAVDAARAVGYRSAGTIEGLLDGEGNYWFLEMNTRIQVEHTITELVTGVDLVREQVAIAAGEPTSVRKGDLRFRGHAIECRINAEDPANGFLPSPGVITAYREPSGPGVRIDSGVTEGSEVVQLYDPLIAKLCVWDVDREHARLRMLRALDELVIEGVTTLVGFHRALLVHSCFVEATTCHGLVESKELAEQSQQLSHQATTLARASDGRLRERVVQLELDGRRYDVKLLEPEPPHVELARRRRERMGGGGHHAAAKEAVISPMQGTVLAVEVSEGDEVSAGQVICVVEAMKMENEITAHRRGIVGDLSVVEGEPVKTGQVICVVTQEGDELEPD